MKKTSIILLGLLLGMSSLFAQTCGDANSSGAIDIVDALMIAQYSVGLNPANFNIGAADVSGDGGINIVDALMVAQYYVGIINTFSCSTVQPTTAPTQAPPTSAPTYNPGPVDTSLVGFATVNGSTTGGSGGQTVTVSSASQLIDYISRPEPYVIQVSGTINLPTNPNTDEAEHMYNVASNKTIIGIGSSARITGCGFKIGINVDDDMTSQPSNAINNIIIRNLSFSDYGDDAVNVQMFSHHVWVDHCTLYDGFDGSVDIKRGSSYCTVSWNHFNNTDKTCLLGHDDGNGEQDTGRLKVTYHHNWFDGSIQRNPRVGYGDAHVYNNHAYENSGHFVGAGDGSSIYVEAN